MKKFCTGTLLLSLMLSFACGGETVQPTEPKKEDAPVRYRIACLGDSITEGVGVENEENLWVNVIGSEDFIIKAQNVGISGTTIALPPDHALRPLAFINRYQEIDERSALIIVFGGTNDYGHDVPLGSMQDTDPETFYGALHVLTSGLMEKYPNAKLLFLTPFQRDDALLGAPETTPYNAAGVTMEDYRQAILDVCAEKGIETFDLYNLEGMRLGDETYAAFFPDGLHPNDDGSRLLASAILPKIKQMLAIEG